jgi:uncharacterized membrane protein YedE/YeeE
VIAIVVAASAGVLFGLGLLLSGMTDPGKVIAFLDIAGAWDPSLGLVMAGAIAVHLPVVRLVRARGRGVFADRVAWPAHTRIEPRLLLGAGLFGIGWGLAGYCPGPALVASGSGATSALAFVGAMVVGLALTTARR